MNFRIIFFPLFFIFSFGLHAQIIFGVVVNETGAFVSGVTVTLKDANSHAVVKIGSTNNTGKFLFKGISKGSYYISMTFIGYESGNSPVYHVLADDINVGTLRLSKVSVNLEKVVVQSQKPLIEVKSDKMVVNVDGNINAMGEDALEILRKSPGIQLDKDDIISMNGKNGVQVYMDDKKIPLSGSDLSDYLKGVQSAQIASIELITNPSARYDAAGNAGIINIKLKKNKKSGFNGSVSAGYGIGRFPKYNGGFSFNYRNRRVNFFSSFNYSWNKSYFDISQYRAQLDTVYDQHSFVNNKLVSNDYKAGVEISLNKKSTFGVMIMGTHMDRNILVQSDMDILYSPTHSLFRILKADNKSANKKFNTNFNLNYRFADSMGHVLSIDADYGLYRFRTDQFQPNRFFDKDLNYLYSLDYSMQSPSKIDIYSIKTDYEQGFMGGKLGVGAKVSYVRSDNEFNRYNVFGITKSLDSLRSNDFIYKENINALYLSYKRQVNKILIQAGLRIENTNLSGSSTGYKSLSGIFHPSDSIFNRNYTNFFPQVSVTLNKNPNLIWGLNYSRRIDRPVYQDLNPFEFKVDEYTYQQGNINLQPQFTNAISLTNTIRGKLTTSLGYSHVADVITPIFDTIDRYRGFLTKRNLAKQDIINLTLSYPVSIKWYSAFIYLNSFYTHYGANLGAGRLINIDAYSLNLNMQHSLRFGKGFTGEVTGLYSSPTIWSGTFRRKGLWSVSAGVQKLLFKNKASLKFSCSDVFNSLKISGKSDFAGQYININGRSETRQFKLGFSYRFGKASGQSPLRKSGVEEETERIGGQGGTGLGN